MIVEIFILVYLLLILRKYLRLDIWVIMLLGAVLMVSVGALTAEQAYASVNSDVLVFLFGMFVIVYALEISGGLKYFALRIVSFANSPKSLLVFSFAFTAFMSAILVNDAIVLLMVPIMIHICKGLALDAKPYIFSTAFAANIGSLLTPIGNPQNLLIKLHSGITFIKFIGVMIIPVIVSSLIAIGVLYWFYRQDFRRRSYKTITNFYPRSVITDMKLFYLSGILALIAFSGFLLSDVLNLRLAFIAVACSVPILLFSGKRKEIIKKVDWQVLVFFASLFIVIAALNTTGIVNSMLGALTPLFSSTNAFVSSLSINFVSAFLSQLFSNVPLVIMLIPIMGTMGSEKAWLSLASGSTLGGTGTLLGSAANVIVLESAESNNHTFGFFEFAKIGIVIMLSTVFVSSIIIALVA